MPAKSPDRFRATLNMANAHARAHVASLTTIPVSVVDSQLGNRQSSDDENDEQTTGITPRLNQRERRKQKQQKAAANRGAPEVEAEHSSEATIPSATTSDDESEDHEGVNLSRMQRKKLEKQKQKQKRLEEVSKTAEPTTPPNNPSKPRGPPPSTPSIPPPLTTTMPPGTYPLLVCSLGNPGPQYAQTLHSAGHIILNQIRERGLYFPFKKGLSGLVSTPNNINWKYHIIYGFQKDGARGLKPGEDDFTLWQSTKMMNVSGPSVKSAWKAWERDVRERGLEGRLVVVHDELEAPLGTVKVKEGSASPRGHNGLKSCQAALGGIKWWRVGIGIGRPESREPDVVAKYVLSRMNYVQEKAMDGAAVGVLKALRDIAEG